MNAIAPGAVDSSWMVEWTNEERQQSIEHALLKRRCQPEDLAEVIAVPGLRRGDGDRTDDHRGWRADAVANDHEKASRERLALVRLLWTVCDQKVITASAAKRDVVMSCLLHARTDCALNGVARLVKAWSQRISGRISRPVTGAGNVRLLGHAHRQSAIGRVACPAAVDTELDTVANPAGTRTGSLLPENDATKKLLSSRKSSARPFRVKLYRSSVYEAYCATPKPLTGLPGFVVLPKSSRTQLNSVMKVSLSSPYR